MSAAECKVTPFFAEMEHFIGECRKMVDEGQEPDMQGLDNKTGTLCEMILALSQDERVLHERRLQELLASLNTLGNEMRIKEGIKEIPQHRNASVAYKTADSRDNFGKRDEEKS